MSYFKEIRELRQTPVPKGGPKAWGAKCDICPLKGATPVMGDGPVNAKLAIVGEAPGREEEKTGIPFCGKSGSFVEAHLTRHGLTRRDVLLDNAVACFPPGGDMDAFIRNHKKELKAKGGEFVHPKECCRPRLMWSLGIGTCLTCGKYEQGADHCTCKRGTYSRPMGRSTIRSVLYVGNVAMSSLLGTTGIMDRRGYVDDLLAHRGGTR